jgi:hypothetical protein
MIFLIGPKLLKKKKKIKDPKPMDLILKRGMAIKKTQKFWTR